MEQIREKKRLHGWIILLVGIISMSILPLVEDLSYVFLALLAINLAAVFLFRLKFTPNARRVAQILIGLLFMFSGFVKGVDPLGTTFRIEDYFLAYETEWAKPIALYCSILLNMVEFVLGFMLFANIKPRITIWLTTLLMAVFTVVTLGDALFSPVPDCGCFGDAIILSNWQTFYKNLIINTFILSLLLNIKALKCRTSNKIQWGATAIMILIFVGFEIYNLTNLPVVDFRLWKKEKQMVELNRLPVEYYVTYKNKISGENKEYALNKLPYQDTSWVKNWSFVSQHTIDPNPRTYDLQIIDNDGADITQEVLMSQDAATILLSYDLEKADKIGLQNLVTLGNNIVHAGHYAIMLTPATDVEIDNFKEQYKPDFEIYNADDIALKSMVRSNPGLLLVKDGKVLNKWAWRNFPSAKEIEKKYYK